MRWGRRRGQRTLAFYGRLYFSLLARFRWGRVELEALTRHRAGSSDGAARSDQRTVSLRGGDNVPCLPLARARGQLYGDSGWGVEDIERVVDELASKGVVFERYDEGPIITNDKGIATFERDAKVAYFKDPDGNTLSIAQAPRS